MTTKEAVALLERYSNYDGMGIPNLAGCKEAMRVAVDALKEAYPELRESEDERVRKAIIKSIEEDSSVYEQEVSKEQMLAYLEKQKVVSEYGKALYYYDGKSFHFAGYPVMEEKQKEQKPTESISQLTVQGKGVYKICPRCKERMVRDDSMVYTSMPPQYIYECPKCGERECDTVMYDSSVDEKQQEQKPILSDRDLTDFEIEVHEIIAQARNDSRLNDADVLKQFEEEAAFALMLKANKLIEQKPAEWSEEDEKIRARLYEYFQELLKRNEDCYKYGGYVRWEDLDVKSIIAWLKSLRPKSHWKPSEGQMKALQNAVALTACDKELARLYNQLKKL